MSEIMDDKEVGRWQQAIYERCCKAVEGLRETRTIDGAGCDSGDPLDLTLTEIGQAFNGLRDEIVLLKGRRDKSDEDFGGLYLDFKKAERERDKAQLKCEELDAKLYEIVRTDHPRAVYSRCQLFSQQDCVGCGCVICGDNENPLVKQIKELEQEREKSRMNLVAVRQDVERMEDAWRKAKAEAARSEAELLRARELVHCVNDEGESVIVQGDAEVKRLREALEKAASTLEDTATDLRLLSRIDGC